MKNLCIIGSNIAGLYNAIKYIDYDLNIHIYEKKLSINIDSIDYFAYNFFNDNHTFFINLLKKFDITYNKINITFNEKMYNLINFVTSVEHFFEKKSYKIGLKCIFSKACSSNYIKNA